jgi:hypothetical protein
MELVDDEAVGRCWGKGIGIRDIWMGAGEAALIEFRFD